MSVPKKRKSHSRTMQGRSHHALSPSFSIVCPNCGEATLRHRVCRACGQYRGKQIVKVESAA